MHKQYNTMLHNATQLTAQWVCWPVWPSFCQLGALLSPKQSALGSAALNLQWPVHSFIRVIKQLMRLCSPASSQTQSLHYISLSFVFLTMLRSFIWVHYCIYSKVRNTKSTQDMTVSVSRLNGISSFLILYGYERDSEITMAVSSTRYLLTWWISTNIDVALRVKLDDFRALWLNLPMDFWYSCSIYY